MILTVALVLYTLAMTIANLLVAEFGPAITPVNAFFLIGLDLTLRDWLHVRLRVWQMAILIGFTGLLTLVLNPEAGQIAIASAVAFTAAAMIDWSVFAKLKGTWIFRANGSNIAGAAVDSVIFPTLAFGVLLPHIVLAQFLAKTAGGAFWAYLLNKLLFIERTRA